MSRGVEVSNEAERALKKILESSQKSTTMVRAIARATACCFFMGRKVRHIG